jgi:hypothetical protein
VIERVAADRVAPNKAGSAPTFHRSHTRMHHAEVRINMVGAPANSPRRSNGFATGSYLLSAAIGARWSDGIVLFIKSKKYCTALNWQGS